MTGFAGARRHAQTSLMQVFTDVPHPDAGNGVLTILRLPISPEPDAVAAMANRLNLIEALGVFMTNFLGAWCPDPTEPVRRTVAYCSFIPNFLSRWVRIENFIVNASVHSRMAASYLNQ
ncbi:hypothetical protein [Mycobacterium camsae]|uniref:hypothetical protein n=1 Tax=Mycobacterium gordonae TaxID=1778 RepID=UPI00197F4C6C|nr:hypothetical protein [Mycobacterium gordonae]